MQCSVCWDDFKLDEDVRQLKCEHIFHENCIIPWLELHNTCPVCRQEQEPGGQTASDQNQSQPPNSASESGSTEANTVGSGASRPTASGSPMAQDPWDLIPEDRDRNQDLIMQAMGRSIDVFNSLFG